MALIVAGGSGVHAFLYFEQTELRIMRGLELFVREDFCPGGVVYGRELDLIDVRDFTQLFADADVVTAVRLRELAAGDGDILVVIDGKIGAFAVAGSQWGDAEYVGDELNFL